MSRSRFLHFGIALYGALVAVGIAGCADTTEPLEAIIWEGTLQSTAEAPSPFVGTIAMVAEQQITRLGIGIEGGTDSAEWGWQLLLGTCPDADGFVAPEASFPPLQLDESGSAEAETVLQRRLPRAVDRAVKVFENPDATGAVLACGNLIENANPQFGY